MAPSTSDVVPGGVKGQWGDVHGGDETSADLEAPGSSVGGGQNRGVGAEAHRVGDLGRAERIGDDEPGVSASVRQRPHHGEDHVDNGPFRFRRAPARTTDPAGVHGDRHTELMTGHADGRAAEQLPVVGGGRGIVVDVGRQPGEMLG